MAHKKQESTGSDSSEQEMIEELLRAFNRQLGETFIRVQIDYGHVGTRMVESVNAVLDDQPFIDFLFGFFDGALFLPDTPSCPDEDEAYLQAMTSTLLLLKSIQNVPVNVPCHAEDVLVGDRYLRRFMREFFLDTFKAKMAEKNHQNQ